MADPLVEWFVSLPAQEQMRLRSTIQTDDPEMFYVLAYADTHNTHMTGHQLEVNRAASMIWRFYLLGPASLLIMSSGFTHAMCLYPDWRRKLVDTLLKMRAHVVMIGVYQLTAFDLAREPFPFPIPTPYDDVFEEYMVVHALNKLLFTNAQTLDDLCLDQYAYIRFYKGNAPANSPHPFLDALCVYYRTPIFQLPTAADVPWLMRVLRRRRHPVYLNAEFKKVEADYAAGRTVSLEAWKKSLFIHFVRRMGMITDKMMLTYRRRGHLKFMYAGLAHAKRFMPMFSMYAMENDHLGTCPADYLEPQTELIPLVHCERKYRFTLRWAVLMRRYHASVENPTVQGWIEYLDKAERDRENYIEFADSVKSGQLSLILMGLTGRKVLEFVDGLR